MEPIIRHNISDEGKAADAAVQKAVSNFLPDLAAIVQQLERTNKNKKSLINLVSRKLKKVIL